MKETMTTRYFLKADFQTERQEVTKIQFIQAERIAGFYSNTGPGTCATGGFSGNGVSGTIKHESE